MTLTIMDAKWPVVTGSETAHLIVELTGAALLLPCVGAVIKIAAGVG
jgi:hypothetical protein